MLAKDAEERFAGPVDVVELRRAHGLDTAKTGNNLTGGRVRERKIRVTNMVQQSEKLLLPNPDESVFFQRRAQISVHSEANGKHDAQVKGNAFLTAGDTVAGEGVLVGVSAGVVALATAAGYAGDG